MWSTREEMARNATVEVQDGQFEVRPGEPFAGKVKEIAESKGIRNFKVYLNGDTEVGPSNAPSTFRSGDVVKVVPYDKAAV